MDTGLSGIRRFLEEIGRRFHPFFDIALRNDAVYKADIRFAGAGLLHRIAGFPGCRGQLGQRGFCPYFAQCFKEYLQGLRLIRIQQGLQQRFRTGCGDTSQCLNDVPFGFLRPRAAALQGCLQSLCGRFAADGGKRLCGRRAQRVVGQIA